MELLPVQPAILPKTQLGDFLSCISEKHSLVIPAEEDGMVDFRGYAPERAVQIRARPARPVKRFVFPQREKMFTFPVDSSNIISLRSESAKTRDRQVIIGVHPCDARAIELLALVFLHDSSNPHRDPYFQKRVDSTILIGWACNTPAPHCFCHAVGGHPHGRDGLDAMMIDLGDLILVEAITDLGQSVMDLYDLVETSDEAVFTAAQLGETVKASMPTGLKLGLPMTQDCNELFDLSLWEETAERCLNCGICTYLCPTCSCFDILDHAEAREYCRFRTWDSCMFSLFTRHASGYNPRSTSAKRLRQRFMHKLKYFPDLHDKLLSCVGCGRCVRFCPVNIDIREVAARMITR